MRSAFLKGVCAVITALCAATASPSAPPHPQNGATVDLAGIAHVALRVGDLQVSRDFYEKLGYEEAFALDRGGKPAEAFLKINDRQFIELYPKRAPGDATGFLHVCFESRDLNALQYAYVARGLTPTPVKKAAAGNLLFTLRGPENQNIEYTQYMPGSRHTLDAGKHLGPRRIADALAGAAIPAANPAAVAAFYESRLSFRPRRRGLDGGPNALRLPGRSNEELQFLRASEKGSFRLMLSVADTNVAARELLSRGIACQRQRKFVLVRDPDGNAIVLVHVPGLTGATR